MNRQGGAGREVTGISMVPGAWRALVLLAFVYALNIADRYVMSVLIEPIKADLGLSDSSVALLTGVALAVFYVTAGLPLATLGDRVNRRNLVAASLAAWSLATALCGLTRSFGQLLCARILVGVGEAGGTPSSVSLISDFFPWRRRALALSLYSIGASVGSMIGSSAGYLSDKWGWRSALFVLGMPGVALALALVMGIREPTRGQLDSAEASMARSDLMDVLRYVVRTPALVHCMIGGTLYTLWAWGLMWWTPSYLVRSHHMSVGAAGGALSLMHGIGGTAVLILTSVVMKRMSKSDPRAVPRFLAIVCAVGTIPAVVAYSTHSQATALAMLWLFIPLSYATFGPSFALVQNVVPPAMRAQSQAILLFVGNVANLIIAPQIVGIVSDALMPHFGSESLRFALLPLTVVGVWAAWHFWRSGRDVAEGLRRAKST